MSKISELEGLRTFKTKQDTFNEEKFIQSSDYVDGDGIIKTDKLPPGVSELVLIHAVDGKDLSTNDFTDELKDKLADISGDINLSVGDEAPSGGIWIDPLK